MSNNAYVRYCRSVVHNPRKHLMSCLFSLLVLALLAMMAVGLASVGFLFYQKFLP